MSEIDPLTRLLQTADTAADIPPVAAELPQRVRQRRAAKVARSRRIAAAALAAGAVLLVSVFVRHADQVIDHKSPAVSSADEIARIRAKADALIARANSLESVLVHMKHQERVTELAEQYQQLLSNSPALNPAESAIDQAAVIALCQGDFFWQHLDAKDAAENAYRSVVKHFPDSRWATIANQKISQLQMN
jgi:hypothetical protein